MTESTAVPKPSAKELKHHAVLISRKQRHWEQLQICFDLIPSLPQKLDVFKIRASRLPECEKKFAAIMDELAVGSMQYEELHVDTGALIRAFDDLYVAILVALEKYSPEHTETVAVASTEHTLQLPEIHIKKFSGKHEDFPAFVALYNDIIHNSNLPIIKKFSYLLSYLEGEALRLVNTVTFQPNNYPIAYDLLVKRYTSKRLIANHYLTAIFNLKALKSNHGLRELVDVLSTNMSALRSLEIDKFGDYVLLEIALRLLDIKTRKSFESKHLHKDFPEFDNLVSYLRDQCSVEELTSVDGCENKRFVKSDEKDNRRTRITMGVQEVSKPSHTASMCICCSGYHKLSKCPSFLAASPRARYNIVRTQRRCYACFGEHRVTECSSKFSCVSCGSNTHNSLLHFGNYSDQKPTAFVSNSLEKQPATSGVSSKPQSVTLANSCQSFIGTQVILGTAQALLLGISGEWHRCRLVFDTGSQVNIISTELALRLGLTRAKCPYELTGVGQTSPGRSQGIVTCSIAPRRDAYAMLNFQAVVLPRITADLPTVKISPEIKNRFAHLDLADPDFDKTGPVDLLLGVGATFDLTPGVPSHIKGIPSAILTKLGWVIMGSLPILEDANKLSLSVVTMLSSVSSNLSLDKTLRAFWENEEIYTAPLPSPEDAASERHFCDTFTRDCKGRYITRLPFKDGIPRLGCNRDIALKRFLKLEERFRTDNTLRRLYSDNIREYVSQGHLVPTSNFVPYVMTHHGVIKHTSQGPKIRVVFNPAEKDPHGVTLNDTLISGPKLQSEIGQIITRFRLPQIGLMCDIKQMFREIALHPSDRRFQHIFWRFSEDEPVQEWEHTRVIFGATCSPFLAQRVLQQLVKDEGLKFPLASAAMKSSIYVDDILTGADTESDVMELRRQLVSLLELGGFKLDKWSTSQDKVIPASSSQMQELPGDGVSPIKVLGLNWEPNVDNFRYVIKADDEKASKRGILSRVARIYDINGYLAPFVFKLKALLQLWLLKVDWDEPLPEAVLHQWNHIVEELLLLEKIAIPRCILSPGWKYARLIGFSDASSIGMGAVVYLRLELDSLVKVSIVAAKTRVAPLKTWTIPRLELNAACLLSKLLASVTTSLSSITLASPICFSDSSTTLAWIKTSPHLLKIFVANRVTQIHEQAPDALWRFVPATENPADATSRGLLPSELLEHSLWWNGPRFLREDEEAWPRNLVENPSKLPELKEKCVNLSVASSEFVEIIDRTSSLLKLQRIVAYVQRFIFNIKCKINKMGNSGLRIGPLSSREYHSALQLVVKLTQAQYLSVEINSISKGKLCSKRYRSLSPFLNSQGFVMVGGRLKWANIPKGARHPFLIPRESRLATMLVDYVHLYSAHGGPQLIQSLLHRNYWIPNARDLIRKRIFRCLVCYRFQATPIQPQMADLPDYRVQPSRCFSHTGIDFAGPFFVKVSNLRTAKTVKCYFALLVCMVTKAIHLEAVTDLTTNACLAALDRFIARRGLPARIYSDQGRNFKGAAREISEISCFLKANNEEFAHYLAERNIDWNFNPPYAPHFGRLWESGVKSVKHRAAPSGCVRGSQNPGAGPRGRRAEGALFK